MKNTEKVKPSLRPHTASPMSDTHDAWFYESMGGIEVIAVRDRVTTQVRIPWSKIMKAAVRCGWKVRRDGV